MGAFTELITLFTSYTANGSEEIGKLDTEAIRSILNKEFKDTNCTELIFTQNTDKMFFGVQIIPFIATINPWLFEDEIKSLKEYKLEIDSKLFSVGLSPEEIAAYVLHEVSSMFDPSTAYEVRGIIDKYQAYKDDCIRITDAYIGRDILKFAIKDTLSKVSSIKYKTQGEIESNPYTKDFVDFLISGLNKINTSVFGIGGSVREPNLVILQWAFNVYCDINHNAMAAKDVLIKAGQTTGSELVKEDIKKTIDNLGKEDNRCCWESTFNEAGKGLFANLKRNGLRSIEDDLYEFTIRVNNAEVEEDAYFALKQINTRINMLEEYLYTNPNLPESEVRRWRDVANRYRELRAILTNKKIGNKKQYGIFFDYDKLDQL